MALDLSQQFPGLTVLSDTSFVNEFEEDSVEGVLGVDVRIPSTRAFIHVESSLDGDNSSIAIAVAYGFGM